MKGRPKKYRIDKSRAVTINLTGPASVLLGEIRKKSKAFDFGKYISMRLMMDFLDDNKEQLLLREIALIQLEQDLLNDKFNNMKRAKAIALNNLREEKRKSI